MKLFVETYTTSKMLVFGNILVHIFSYSVQMWGNADLNNSEYRQILRSVIDSLKDKKHRVNCLHIYKTWCVNNIIIKSLIRLILFKLYHPFVIWGYTFMYIWVHTLEIPQNILCKQTKEVTFKTAPTK